jgi:hypothetical protein
MPIEIVSGEEAFAARRANARARWPRPDDPTQALYPLTLPRFTPRFTLDRADRIFCIGSCFAREIEAVLARYGFTVLSALEPDERTEGNAGVTNRYTVPAMRDEVARALAGAKTIRTPDATEASDRAARSFSRLRDASVVVLTLGLSEAWYDKELGCYLNQAPPEKSVVRGRFELHVLGVDETIAALEELLALLREKLGARVLLTVSPVPLHSTFRDADVITANAYSKAVLRCAAELAAVKHEEVAYFPSFEMVTTSDHRAVFGGADYRHVDRDFVDLIMSHSLGALIPDRAQDFADQADGARARLREKLGGRRSVAVELEARVMKKILSPRRLRKYERGRAAFFEDSSSRWVRLFGRVIR